MDKITVENFGPLKSVTLPLKDLNLFIGPQASGKSTLVRMIYFFYTLPEEIFKVLLKNHSSDTFISEINNTLYLRWKAVFGQARVAKNFRARCHYAHNIYVEICPGKDGFPYFQFNNVAIQELLQMHEHYSQSLPRKGAYRYDGELKHLTQYRLWQQQQAEMQLILYFQLNKIFRTRASSIFVPAARSMAVLLGYSPQVLRKLADPLLKEFIEKVDMIRREYQQPLKDLIQEKQKLGSGKTDTALLEKARRKIERILKGRYLYSSAEGERLYFGHNEYVRLTYASSGQQEVLWVLLLAFAALLQNEQIFLIVEEPEAHLHPAAQKDLLELLVLLLNARPGNRVTMTTHSPYMLTSLNLCLSAGRVKKALEQQKKPPLDKHFALSKSRTGAYLMELNESGFTFANIMDQELGLVKAETIDQISDIINQKMDELLDLEE